MSKNKVSRIKKKNVNTISYIIYGLFCLISLLLIINIFKLNMLPFKITFLILLVEIVVLGVSGFVILHKNIKWKIKIGSDIFLLIVSIISLFANHYIDSTISFLRQITDNNYAMENYYVLVLKDSKLSDEDDLLDKKVGYVSKLGSNEEALEELKDVVVFETVTKKDIFELGNSLLDSDVDAILIADYHKALLDEEIENFDNKVKIIYQFSIKKESTVKSASVDVTKDSFNIFLSGIDTYGEVSSIARSDVNMIITVNPVTKQILLTSIPRDYYVELAGYNEKDKLTHAGYYGIDCSIDTIENLLDIEINYYIRVNFSSLVSLVDVLGGINVYSEYSFDTYGYKFSKGYNYINGEYALAFSRARYNFVDGDRQRVKNQQAVIRAIVDKAMSPSILNKYTSILESLSDLFQTNMNMSDIQKLAKFQIDKMPKWSIASISLNGSDAEGYTYSYGDQKLYVMQPDMETVNKATETIGKVMQGKEIDVDSTVTDSSNSNVTQNTTGTTTTSSTTESTTNTTDSSTTTTTSTSTTTMTTTTTTTTATTTKDDNQNNSNDVETDNDLEDSEE